MRYGATVGIHDKYVLIYRELGYKSIMIKGFKSKNELDAYIHSWGDKIDVIRILWDAE